jgi:RNA polymerase sigma-B factor
MSTSSARVPHHPQSERDLLARIHRDGDEGARAEMIERSMNLVHHIARRYQGRGIAHEELVQVGCIGLIKAVDRFDPERGVTFSTFAVPNIAGEIRRHFRDHGWALRVSRSVQEHSALISKTTERLAVSLQRNPTLKEIAAATELTMGQVLEALDGGRHYVAQSLDAPADSGGEDTTSRVELLGERDAGFERAEARITALQGMRCLQERERQILALRFGADMTQSEIAERLGISQMHVSRLLRQALEDVREHIEQDQTVAVGLSSTG